MIGNNYANLAKNKNFAATQNNTSNNAGSAPAFKGATNKLADFGKKYFDFCGIDMPFIALPFYTFGIVLTSRILKARDENEKREVFTRDAATIGTILFGVPVLNKLFAKFSRNILNVPISLKPDVETKTISQKIFSPIKKIWGEDLAGFDRLKHWFKYDGAATKENFLKNIVKIGKEGSDNSLGKLFSRASSLDNELRDSLKGAFGLSKISELKGKTNSEIINKLVSTEGNAVFARLKDDKNGLLKMAKIVKSIPGVANIALVASMLGIFIPWFNAHKTKQIMAAKLRDTESKNITSSSATNNKPSQDSTESVKLNNSQQTLFKSFIRK